MVAIKDMEMPKSCMSCPKKHGCNIGCFNGWLEDRRASDCPLVEIEERNVGKWIEVWESQRDEFSGEYDEWREHKCSICDFQEMDAARFNFCPNCGAEMVGAENG